ncbi:hypothetical protein WJX79_001768 [Trebouxia sp. C0005]
MRLLWCRPRGRALELVKKHAPEHLDTAKKTKWVVELVQGIMADHDAATEDAQTQHSAELAASKQETADAVAESMESAAQTRLAKEEMAAVQQAVYAAKAEVQAAKVALEQAEMSAVVAATECMNMQKVAQAGSQGDKKARRVLSLRAHHLKETLLKAKTDLKAHKATARQQAYQIEVMSREHEVAAAAACQLTEQLALQQQQQAAKQALKQSKSQSRLYQTKPAAEAEGTATIAAAHPKSTVGPHPTASPGVSPARTVAPVRSPIRPAAAAPRPQQIKEEGVLADKQVPTVPDSTAGTQSMATNAARMVGACMFFLGGGED